jgi:hypothetical protein
LVHEFAVLVTINEYVPPPEAEVEDSVLLLTDDPAGATQLKVTPPEVDDKFTAVLVQFTTPEFEAATVGCVWFTFNAITAVFEH